MKWRLTATAVLLATALALGAGAAADTGTPLAMASPDASFAACPVTQPNGVQPPPEAHVFGRGAGDYGNDALWTSLWVWGEGAVLVPPDEHVQADGSFGPMKWPWWRGVPGELVIEGRRLDAPAPPLQAFGPSGRSISEPLPTPSDIEITYSATAFHPTGLVFPTGGCWEITGRVGEASLTFVVLVVPPTVSATPIAS